MSLRWGTPRVLGFSWGTTIGGRNNSRPGYQGGEALREMAEDPWGTLMGFGCLWVGLIALAALFGGSHAALTVFGWGLIVIAIGAAITLVLYAIILTIALVCLGLGRLFTALGRAWDGRATR